jgi:c-di-GMP-binding flagellar brake protein YcgR
MENAQSISGNKILDIIDQLKKDKTALKLTIPEIGYEGLTIILDLKNLKTSPILLIDFPGGLQDKVMNTLGKTMLIEFNGPDKIPYSFRTVIQKVTEDYLVVAAPKSIIRIQRRKFFRIPSPLGTKVIINEKDQSYEFNVINISEGGILVSHPEERHEDLIFFKGAIKSLLIIYEDGINSLKIRINKAEIRRIDVASETRRYHYAFQFLDRGIKEENLIMNFIYAYQRKLLERRTFQGE